MNLPELIQGKLPAYSSIGSYPLIYLDKQNSCLCAECATESLNDEVEAFRAVCCDVYYEGPSITCDCCSTEIESACGDPNPQA